MKNYKEEIKAASAFIASFVVVGVCRHLTPTIHNCELLLLIYIICGEESKKKS